VVVVVVVVIVVVVFVVALDTSPNNNFTSSPILILVLSVPLPFPPLPLLFHHQYSAVNPTIEDGLFNGGYHTFYKNIVGAIFAAFYASTMSYILWKALDLAFDIHVSAEESKVGLDFSIHGEYSVKDNMQKKLATLEEADSYTEVEMTGHSLDESKGGQQ